MDARWLEPDDLRAVEPLAATGRAGGAAHRAARLRRRPRPDRSARRSRDAGRRHLRARDARPVESLPRPNRRVIVETENGPSAVDHAILAAGSWTGQLGNQWRVEPSAVKPVRGQLLHLAWPTAQPLRHVLWGPDCYIVPWLNGRVLVGATVEDAGFDERATAAGVRDLLEAGCSLVPHLWQASFAEVRVGLRPASPDGLPIVGRSTVIPGLIYATGHYRNGVLLAPLTAALVKDIVLGNGSTTRRQLRPRVSGI